MHHIHAFWISFDEQLGYKCLIINAAARLKEGTGIKIILHISNTFRRGILNSPTAETEECHYSTSHTRGTAEVELSDLPLITQQVCGKDGSVYFILF